MQGPMDNISTLDCNISVRYEENNGKNGLMKIQHAATWKDDSSNRSRVPSAFSDLYSALLLSLLSHSLFHNIA